MSDKKYLEPQNGELKANEIVKFFDNEAIKFVPKKAHKYSWEE